MEKYKLNIELINKIIDSYKNGVDIEQIMLDLNLTESQIREVLKSKKIDRSYNSFTTELKNRIKVLYESGYTYSKIKETLLISENGIRKNLKRMNVTFRSSSENNRKYNRDQHYFDSIDTYKKAYILGLLYSDGSNDTEHNSIVLSLQESDVDVLKQIKEELKYEGPIYYIPLQEKNKKYKNQYRLCINDEYISSVLEAKGVVNNKSLILTFPDFLSEELLPAFICGYFDGDGCIYCDQKRDKYQTVTVGTQAFCNKLSEILYSWGIKHSIKHPKQCKDETVVLQTCGNKSSYMFLSKIYNNSLMHIDRKYIKFLELSSKYQNKSYSK